MSSERSTYGAPETRLRILEASWQLIAERGSSLELKEVAQVAGVSRQSLYLHFGDRSGLILALVHHMDESLELGESLALVMAAETGTEVLTRVMRLNTEFWNAVFPVAQVLESAQHEDETLGQAWRDRMQFRQIVFNSVIDRVVELGELDNDWDPKEAGELLYAVAHFDTWRELTRHLGWSDDQYVNSMAKLLRRSLLHA